MIEFIFANILTTFDEFQFFLNVLETLYGLFLVHKF